MEVEKLMEVPTDRTTEHWYPEKVLVERPVRVVAGGEGVTDYVEDAEGNRLLTVIRYPKDANRPDVYFPGKPDGKTPFKPLTEIWSQLERLVLPRVAFVK